MLHAFAHCCADTRVAASFRSFVNEAAASESDSDAFPLLISATTSCKSHVTSDVLQTFLFSVHIESPDEATRMRMLRALLADASPLASCVRLDNVAQRTAVSGINWVLAKFFEYRTVRYNVCCRVSTWLS